MEKMFGETLRDLRLEAGVGLRELARLIGKSPGYLSDVENGRVPPPSEPVILDIAIAPYLLWLAVIFSLYSGVYNVSVWRMKSRKYEPQQ